VWPAFSVYFGWITVATIVNVASALDAVGWSGEPLAPQLWAAIMLGVAALIGVLMGIRHGDVWYVGVLVWAFAGVAANFPQEAALTVSSVALALLMLPALGTGVARRVQRLRIG
jgi:hypothetical protein